VKGESKQSQTQGYVSRIEPLLYVPAFNSMKDFHHDWSHWIINRLQVLTRTLQTHLSSLTVPQHQLGAH